MDPEIGTAGQVGTIGMNLTTTTGKVCQMSNSHHATYGYDKHPEVHGSKSMLEADNVLLNTVECADYDGYRKVPLEHL